MQPYVGIYKRSIDDRHRLQLPAAFEIDVGERLYIEKVRSNELACYDSQRFKEMSAAFARSQFRNYRRLSVESAHRVCLNGEYNLPPRVLIEGMGDHFTVRGLETFGSRILNIFKFIRNNK